MEKSVVHLPLLENGMGKTLRKDAWWVGPLLTFTILTGFIVYANFRIFENRFFAVGPYLTPFYSCTQYFSTDGLGIPLLTPAMIILIIPASFRFTCYYYRKAYYRAFAMSPPACAVGSRSPGSYNGEKKLLIFQNLHRFALYLAIVFILLNWHDAYESLWWHDSYTNTGIHGMPVGQGEAHFHVGVGTVVLILNCVLLSLYTFSCHSFRHLIGGNLNSYSTAPLGELRHNLWKLISKGNENHMLYAWVSLFGVALTDLYIRQVASGAITDVRIF